MHQARGAGSANDQESIDRPNGQQAVALVGDAARNHGRIDALLSGGVMVILLPSLETLDSLVAPGHVPGKAASSSDSATTVGNLLIDLTEHRVQMGQLELRISERELAILAALCKEPGRARTFAELATATPGDGAWLGDTELVHSAVKRLRRKLAKAGAEDIIESVRGYGFRLASPSAHPSSLPTTEAGSSPPSGKVPGSSKSGFRTGDTWGDRLGTFPSLQSGTRAASLSFSDE
jgi:DNA-binding winged helix-turn-helix (wHTH) protein